MNALWGQMIPQRGPIPSRKIMMNAHGNRVTFKNRDTVLDGDSGLWNVNLGYGVPSIAHAVERALLEEAYLGQFRFANQKCIQAAEELLKFVGLSNLVRVIFSTAGGAANDAVMKLVRHYQALKTQSHDKVVIVGLQGSYHGLMYGSMGLTGEYLGQNIYEVDPRFVRHVPPNDCETLEVFAKKHGSKIAAFVVEPLLGTGTIPLNNEYVNLIFELREKYRFLVVADEVATGFGRTGKLFASQGWSSSPDVLILSKALTNGASATSAILVSEDIVHEFSRTNQVFVHAETQACSTTGAAAIIATLNEYRRVFKPVMGEPLKMAVNLENALFDFASRLDCVHSLNGQGMFWSMEVHNESGMPINSYEAAMLADAIRDAGALVHPFPKGITICPSLVYTERELDELLSCVSTGLDYFKELNK